MVFFSSIRSRAADAAAVFISHEKFSEERRFLLVVMGSLLGAGVTANQVATSYQVASVNAKLAAVEEVMKMGFHTTDTTIKSLEAKLDITIKALDVKLDTTSEHEKLKATIETLKKSMK